MPNQDITAPSPAGVCPVCRARAGDGASLYAPDGAVIQPGNGRPVAPTVPLLDHLPAHTSTPEPAPWEAPAQTIQFWQGLAIGLGVAIVVLFLALLAA